MSNIDFLNLNGCIVKDERGVALATLEERGGYIYVERTAACGIGMYLYILAYLKELGFEVR